MRRSIKLLTLLLCGCFASSFLAENLFFVNSSLKTANAEVVNEKAEKDNIEENFLRLFWIDDE